VTHYNSPNPEYNSIRLKILSDKLSECVKEEDYLTAAKVRDKINIIKEKGK
jgi:protein-arginine kinase activator protein McsA